MSGTSTVLWDVGGVLLTNGWDHAGRSVVLAHFGVEAGEFERRHATVNDEWERGLIDVEEYLATTVFHEPRAFTPSNFLDQMKAQSQELPGGGLRILRQMAASGDVELGILNNEARELNDYRLKAFGLLPLFEFFFSSCYVALRKPGEKIYRCALDVLQRTPGEVVFIDDRAENVAAASAIGIHGIQFQGEAQLGRELDALGVAVTV